MGGAGKALPCQYRTWTADYGLRTGYKIQTRYKTRTGKYGLVLKHGLYIKRGMRTGYKIRTRDFVSTKGSNRLWAPGSNWFWQELLVLGKEK